MNNQIVGTTDTSPYSPPESPTQDLGSYRFMRASKVLTLSVIIAASSILMIGPQIVVVVPLALGLGILFAVRRSYWSLVCFGYPFTFGLISAWIGYKEMPGYEQTAAFSISIGIGLIACAMTAAGLWSSLPSEQSKKSQ